MDTNEEPREMREKYWWEHYPLHKIWCNDYCPLVPRFNYRKADEYNTDSYSLHWLIFHFWTMDHFSFGLDAGLGFDEIYIGACLPYLRITVGIRHIYNPTIYKISRFLRRKSESEKKQGF